MSNQHINILNKATVLFYRYGIRSISMDDIAREAGVSKKTIYQYYEDKNALVQAIAAEFVLANREILFECAKKSDDAVEEVVLQVERSFATLADINFCFFHEIEKYFPEAWQIITRYKNQTLQPIIITNLNRGIAEGYYNETIDPIFIADIRVQQITTALDPKDFTQYKYSAYDMMIRFTLFYLQSITTAKGKQKINKYLINHNEQQSI